MLSRIERHIILKDPLLDDLCFKSKNLYNYCNFILRQLYFKKLDKLEEFKDLIKLYKDFYKIDAYDLITRLTKLNQPDFRALPSHTSQQTILLLYKNWKCFFKLLKCKDLKGRPRIPSYKKKDGKNIVIFDLMQIKLKKTFIHFPKKIHFKPLRTKVSNIQQVRIIPKAVCYVIEVVYRKEITQHELNDNLYLGIDLGVNNLATCANNVGLKPFIINGKIVKSINQYYNKKKALLQSYVGSRSSRKIHKLSLVRNCKIEDYFHKASKYIIDYCLENKIKTIVVGKNKGWKQEVDMGKINNQHFVFIPFNKLIEQLRYKGEEVGITVQEVREPYTSKCSFLDLEEMKHQASYLGKRIKRGLFRSAKGLLINADVNAAFNMIRKVTSNAFKSHEVQDLVINPEKVSLCF